MVTENGKYYPVTIAVVVEPGGTVCTCGVSGSITKEIAMKRVLAKTMGVNMIAQGWIEAIVPLARTDNASD
jgi:hypothetical protein